MKNKIGGQIDGARTLRRHTHTQTIERAATLVRAVAGYNRTGLRLVDLVDLTGLETPTTHRLLKSLVFDNFLKQDSSNRRYFLGSLMFEASLAMSDEVTLTDICQATLVRTSQESGDTVYLNVRRDHEQVCIDRKEGVYSNKVLALNIGDRRPLGVGSGGIAILSAMPDQDAQVIIKRIATALPRYGGMTERLLISLIKRSRKQGYVLRDLAGLGRGRALGVAIKNQHGEPIAALSIAGSTDRMPKNRCEKLATLLKREVGSIERKLLSSQRAMSLP